MPSWFEKTPKPEMGSNVWAEMRWNVHEWGAQTFPKAYARGGIVGSMFAPGKAETLTSPWRHYPEGSKQYVQRLRALEKLYPESPAVQKAIKGLEKSATKGAIGKKILGKVGGAGLMGYMVLEPAFSAEGPPAERARAATIGVGRLAGFGVGTKIGAGVGALVGKAFGGWGAIPGALIGALAGGIIGDIVAGETTDRLTRVTDRMVDRERERRGLNWGQHRAAFQTKRAATMRQQSLQLMNRGSMSARSLLGQEAMFVHK